MLIITQYYWPHNISINSIFVVIKVDTIMAGTMAALR